MHSGLASSSANLPPFLTCRLFYRGEKFNYKKVLAFRQFGLVAIYRSNSRTLSLSRRAPYPRSAHLSPFRPPPQTTPSPSPALLARSSLFQAARELSIAPVSVVYSSLCPPTSPRPSSISPFLPQPSLPPSLSLSFSLSLVGQLFYKAFYNILLIIRRNTGGLSKTAVARSLVTRPRVDRGGEVIVSRGIDRGIDELGRCTRHAVETRYFHPGNFSFRIFPSAATRRHTSTMNDFRGGGGRGEAPRGWLSDFEIFGACAGQFETPETREFRGHSNAYTSGHK